MEKTITGLVALLHEQADIFETLLEILKKENQALVRVNVETLHRLAKEKETLSLKGRVCETTRHLQPALIQARDRLLKVAEEIVLINCQNGALIQDSLRLIDSCLNLVREAAGNATYQNGGRLSDSRLTGEPATFSAKA